MRSHFITKAKESEKKIAYNDMRWKCVMMRLEICFFCCDLSTSRMNEMEKKNYYYITSAPICRMLVGINFYSEFRLFQPDKNKMFYFCSENYTQFCTQIVCQDQFNVTAWNFFFLSLFSSCQTAQTTMLIKFVLGKKYGNFTWDKTC